MKKFSVTIGAKKSAPFGIDDLPAFGGPKVHESKTISVEARHKKSAIRKAKAQAEKDWPKKDEWYGHYAYGF